jgi:hypothetical protein
MTAAVVRARARRDTGAAESHVESMPRECVKTHSSTSGESRRSAARFYLIEGGLDLALAKLETGEATV